VFRRRKQSFLAPPPSPRSGGRLYQMLQDTLRSDAMAAVPFFDQRAIVSFLDGLPRLCERSPRMITGVGSQLVYLASACVMQKRFGMTQ
jgi:asparagine synthase (glutamine-hydrolysing)